jgi:hypothetical protein
MKSRLLYTVLFIGLFLTSMAQTPTIGLIQHDAGSTDDGYVLFAPIGSDNTYLIDKCGRKIKSWTSSYRPGLSVYLLPDGNLLRTGNLNNPYITTSGVGGIIEKNDWNNNLVWNYIISDSTQCLHHDIKMLPNGNILALVYEIKTDLEGIAAGRDPDHVDTKFLSEKIVELHPIGTDSASVVWEWHAWDHLVQDFDITQNNYGQISSNPQLININYNPNGDKTELAHLNAIDYNPALDQIIVSSLFYSEIWVIDHSTTTAQASVHAGGNSGKGGDLMYRWGNPATYDQGTLADQKFYHLHNAQWIENGLPFASKIMAFNNGFQRPDGNYSSVEIISPPVDGLGNYSNSMPYGPDSSEWKYTAPVPTDFFALNQSGAQQLSNGNVLICSATNGEFFEINSAKAKVWEYINPLAQGVPLSQGTAPHNNVVFRCIFYPNTYSGFYGQILNPGMPIELNPSSDSCNLLISLPELETNEKFSVFPNPANEIINIRTDARSFIVDIFSIQGQKVFNGINTKTILANKFSEGIYFITIKIETGQILYKKLIITRQLIK